MMMRSLLSVSLAVLELAFAAGPSQAAGTALVRHPPSLAGVVDGSVQMLMPESVMVSGNARVSGDILLPGTPVVTVNGAGQCGDVVNAGGAAEPSSHRVIIGGSAVVGRVLRRTDPVALPVAVFPAAPRGTRDLVVNGGDRPIGDFATVRNLTVNGIASGIAVPPGIYGDFAANGGSGFVLGTAGGSQPMRYAFQRLTLTGSSWIRVLGPVEITLGRDLELKGGACGSADHPGWLVLKLPLGDLTVGSGAHFDGYVVAPAGAVIISAQGQLNGGVACDRLSVNANASLRLVQNLPPAIELVAPPAGATFIGPLAIPLLARASDPDGTVTMVEFHHGSEILGECMGPPYTFVAPNLAPGTHVFSARAYDNQGGSSTSAAVTVTVVGNQAPRVALTSPAAEATFTAPAGFDLEAEASDPDGRVTRVEFFRGGAKFADDMAPPYAAPVAGLPVGSYTFFARAFDDFGASTDSASRTFTVTPPNEPPSVSLLTPADATVFSAPASILLSAAATDTDGTIARVEFFQGTTKLGEGTAAPFEFVWRNVPPGAYTLSARAHDDRGAATTSPPRNITVRIALPYFTGFETTDGYVVGALAGQLGWSAGAGAAISGAASQEGVQSIALAPASPAATAILNFPASAGQSVVFVDVFAKPVAGLVPGQAVFLDTGLAQVALVDSGSDIEVFAFDGSGGSGTGTWRASGVKLGRDGTGAVAAWVRVSLREDFAARRWDLFLNAKLALYDLGFAENAAALSRLKFSGGTAGNAAFDAFYAGFDNPVFVDADRDGMDDAWELANGLNPAVNDRSADADGDGASAIAEYRAGTRPGDFFNGVLPVVQALYGGEPGPQDELAMLVLRPDGTAWPNAPCTFRITSGPRRISMTPGGPDFFTTLVVRTDGSGIGRVFLEPLEP